MHKIFITSMHICVMGATPGFYCVSFYPKMPFYSTFLYKDKSHVQHFLFAFCFICLKARGTPYTCWCIPGLKNSTRPLVFMSASGCKASGDFDISGENLKTFHICQ